MSSIVIRLSFFFVVVVYCLYLSQGAFCKTKLKYFKQSKLTPTNRIPGPYCKLRTSKIFIMCVRSIGRAGMETN